MFQCYFKVLTNCHNVLSPQAGPNNSNIIIVKLDGSEFQNQRRVKASKQSKTSQFI